MTKVVLMTSNLSNYGSVVKKHTIKKPWHLSKFGNCHFMNFILWIGNSNTGCGTDNFENLVNSGGSIGQYKASIKFTFVIIAK